MLGLMHRGATFACLAVAVLALAWPATSAGDAENPEVRDSAGDSNRAQTDLLRAWIEQSDAGLLFRIEVASLGAADSETARLEGNEWGFAFVLENTDYLVRTRVAAGVDEPIAEVLRNGELLNATQLQRAFTAARFVDVLWIDPQDYLPERGVFNMTKAYTRSQQVAQLNDAACTGPTVPRLVIDCGPNDGFGLSFGLGGGPKPDFDSLRGAVDRVRRAGEAATDVEFRIVLTNLGAGDQNLSMGAKVPLRWNVTFAPPWINLTGGESKVTSMRIGIPSAARPGEYPVRAWAENETLQLRFNVTVGVVEKLAGAYDFSMTAATTAAKVVPNEAVHYSMSLSNTGPFPDVYGLSVRSERPFWAVLEQETVSLDAGASETVVVMVRPPFGVSPQSALHIVQARSQTVDSLVLEVSLETTVVLASETAGAGAAAAGTTLGVLAAVAVWAQRRRR